MEKEHNYPRTLGHSGKTSVRVVRCGSVPWCSQSNLIINERWRQDNPSTVDLGGTTQDVQKTLLRGGVLENGSLSSGNQVIVDKFNSNIIADLDGQVVRRSKSVFMKLLIRMFV